MLELRNSFDLLNEILMSEDKSCRSFLLLEGEHEAGILEEFISDAIEPIICGSKSNLMQAGSAADGRSAIPVIGLADRDYDDHISPDRELISNVRFTENYDLIADIIFEDSGVLEGAIRVHRHDGLALIASNGKSTAVDLILTYCTRISAAHLGARLAGVPSAMKRFDFEGVFLDWPSVPNFALFVESLAVWQEDFDVSESDRDVVIECGENLKNDRKLCGGHLIALVMNRIMKRFGFPANSKDNIERIIRASAKVDIISSLSVLKDLNALSLRMAGIRALEFE